MGADGRAPVVGSATPEPGTAGHPASDQAAGFALPPISRRQLLQVAAVAAPSLVGSTLLFEWLSRLTAGPPSPPIDPVVARYDPTAHRWGFVVDAAACIGCGQCVVACKQENDVPLDGEHTRTWVERHSVAVDGTVTVDAPEAGAHGFPALAEAAVAPAGDEAGSAIRETYFVPHLCMQCEESPCTQVCPVGATYRTPDGVILVDEQRCIGCGFCILACPYGARYLVPAGERTPKGVAGVADKCTFCYHRITRGRNPACVDICPVGARRFGDLDDPQSDVSRLLRERPSKVLRAGLGTRPRVHYLGLEAEPEA
ncbi:MAG TPA: 4Fe-4S dicluster domain-containing protein [Candidatus Limnocylindrales bacterium]